MATEHYGGQGMIRQTGKFEIQYTKATPKRGRLEYKKTFTDYSKAQAFYDAIDDSAAIWDVTRGAELCEAKTRLAYFEARVKTIKPPHATKTVVLDAPDEDGAGEHISNNIFRTGWKLVADSVREITADEYKAQPDATLQLLVTELKAAKAR